MEYIFMTTLTGFEDIMLSEKIQIGKYKYHMISHVESKKKEKTKQIATTTKKQAQR